MTIKTLLCALALAAVAFGPAHANTVIVAGDDSVTAADGTVYRISPNDPVAAPPQSAQKKTAYHDTSGVNINVNSFAGQARQYHQPTNHSNWSTVYR